MTQLRAATNLNPSDYRPTIHDRWTRTRKINLIREIQNGVVSLAKAQADFAMSEQEFLDMVEKLALFGKDGLRADARAPGYSEENEVSPTLVRGEEK